MNSTMLALAGATLGSSMVGVSAGTESGGLNPTAGVSNVPTTAGSVETGSLGGVGIVLPENVGAGATKVGCWITGDELPAAFEAAGACPIADD